MTNVANRPTNCRFHLTGVSAIVSCMILSLIIIFLLGIANFALNRAVLGSGHPLIAQMPNLNHVLGGSGRLTLFVEFLILVIAMLLAANGWPGFAWGYAGYSSLNAIAAWLMMSGRI
jgi:hypothetical protein